MKNRSLVLLISLLTTGICLAQKTIIPADTINDTAGTSEVIIGNPYNDIPSTTQRHPNSDLVRQIVNINADKQMVLIQYQEDKETAQFVKELQEELVRFDMKVNTVSSAQPMPMANNPRHNNCTYEITDAIFLITAYPQSSK